MAARGQQQQRGRRASSMFSAVVLVLMALALIPETEAMQCYGDKGQAVDWWVAFKYPNSRKYSYADSTNVSGGLLQSSSSFTTGSPSCLNSTLSQIYSAPSTTTFSLYNDEPAVPTLFLSEENKAKRSAYVDKAHAKGIVAADSNGNGFWLVHSVPKFPVSPLNTTKFQYMEDSQVQYGQSLLCISLKGWSTFNTIGSNLQIIRPDYYGVSAFSSGAKSSAANWYASAVSGTYIHSADQAQPKITTAGGMSVTAFAKSGYYGNGWDMYSQLIAPSLAQELYVQTWRKGSGTPLPSNCTGSYHVINILDISMNGNTWNYLNDHSKWAVASSQNSNWVCICDINRMASQGTRGGGGLCFQSGPLHKSLVNDVSKNEACP
eukprot:TRINITY_DN7566_c0_g1_i1.p1 TRINITY_DN7566_c0_g1~~TRINITY_DN7566_c0_g1_i1.p1  ORF type:complete len:394 (-),score=160.34 TRINITY_DN7566_c0_g1_i1:71-1201(-)